MDSQYVFAKGTKSHDPHPWPLRIEPGDTFVPYTDGLVEARNDKEEYGLKQLRETVTEAGAWPAVEIAQRIMANTNAFTTGAGQTDDVTLVVVKRI